MANTPSVILPAGCLPDIEYFCWLMHSPEVLIEVHETYPKQTCRNRYRIATANGPLVLSVPVNKPQGNHSPVPVVETDRKSNWNIIHWRALESAYNKSPYFLYYRDRFEPLFIQPPVLLLDFNLSLLKTCLNLLNLPVIFRLTDDFVKDSGSMADMRMKIMPKHPENHRWSISSFAPYTQVFSEKHAFQPNLSIVDLLFNLGPEAVAYLQNHIPGK